MKHKRNTKRNKIHRGRKILLSRSDIQAFVDIKKKSPGSKMYSNIKDLCSAIKWEEKEAEKQ